MINAGDFFTKPEQLRDFIGLPTLPIPEINPRFPFLVSRHFAAKIKKSCPDDPLLREIWPMAQENIPVAGFCDDPVGDAASQVMPGILHKYRGRILIEPTFACSLHCRFCFRRFEPKTISTELAAHLNTYLVEHPDISEVILSGGDPMMLPPSQLADLVDVITSQKNIQAVRIHTRTPVTYPVVFSAGQQSIYPLLQKISQRQRLVVVAHIAHPQELDAASAQVFASLHELGATLLNQCALLRGINDDSQTLQELSWRLFSQGVLPYYLHQLDHVNGAAHFEVPDQEAIQLITQMRLALPGYLVPRLVREVAGTGSKTPIF